MTGDLREPSPGHVLVFDVAPTNNGGHYNRYAGMFTAPHSGTYVFTWTSYCESGGYTNLQLVVNANAVDSSYCNADGASWYRSASATAVVQISQGDVVFVPISHQLRRFVEQGVPTHNLCRMVSFLILEKKNHVKLKIQ